MKKPLFFLFLLLIGLCFVLQPKSAPAPVSQPNSNVLSQTATAAPVAFPPPQTKSAGCQASGALPDTACSPGAVFNVGKDQICVSGYAKSVRDVPDSEKNAVYAEYGITRHTAGEYEVDHLISLELGGSNDIANLWPEAAAPTPGFHQKDEVENYLHDQVCAGNISLPTAQQEIATDWLAVYQHLMSR